MEAGIGGRDPILNGFLRGAELAYPENWKRDSCFPPEKDLKGNNGAQMCYIPR